MVATLHAGHNAQYLTRDVAKGRENYYTASVDAGEPAGRWYGRGAEALGLVGEADNQDIEALFEQFVDPRDARFRDKAQWDDATKLGAASRQYQTTAQILAAKRAAEPNRSPERDAVLKAEAARDTRTAVGFLDFTYSPPKSVTVLLVALRAQEQAALRAGDTVAAAGYGAQATVIEDAAYLASSAGLDYLAEHAGYHRVGYHATIKDAEGNKIGTSGRWIEAKEFVVAQFLQHTSRDNDPQLHVHAPILNRSEGIDGKWRTLDSKAMTRALPGASAIADRALFEHLIRELGVEVRTRPDGKSREIVGVDEKATALFSSRRHAVVGHLAGLVTAFETKYNRTPNALELSSLSQQATLATRNRKSKVFETFSEHLDKWTKQLRERVDTTMAEVVEKTIGRLVGPPPLPSFNSEAVIALAQLDVQAKKAAFTRHDLIRALDARLPDCLGGLTTEQIVNVLNDLADRAETPSALLVGTAGELIRLTAPELVPTPSILRRADGSSQFEEPSAVLYATAMELAAERVLQEAARAVDAAPRMDAARVDAALAATNLGEDQAAAVRGVLTSGRRWETLIGPAGTGKSYTVGTLAALWQDPTLWDGKDASNPRVWGLASSQRAVEVMAGEDVGTTINISRWLAAQKLLSTGDSQAGRAELYRLSAGDLIVIDEAGMTSNADLAAIERYAAAAGAKVLATGDPMQLRSVGAGGGMRLAGDAGITYTLTEVRRFEAPWEAQASLGLREGSVEALMTYQRHGRVIDAGNIEQAHALAADAWVADTLQGVQSLLVVSSNEAAAEVSMKIRGKLQQLGLRGEAAVELGLQSTVAGVGDIVQARKNDWTYLKSHGRALVNRELYEVIDITADNGLIVEPLDARGTRIEVKPKYVEAHMSLGYAVTEYCAQGATVKRGHQVVTDETSSAALYVGLTRGRESNTAWVVTQEVDQYAPAGVTPPGQEKRDPLQVLAGIVERYEPDRAAIDIERESLAEAASLRTLGGRYSVVAEVSYEPRYRPLVAELVEEGALTNDQAQELAGADGSVGQLWRLLRAAELAGHQPADVLAGAIGSGPLDDARTLPGLLFYRIRNRLTGQLTPVGDTYSERTPQRVEGEELSEYLTDTATLMDARRHELGEKVAAMTPPPPWALRRLGPLPQEIVEREEWIHTAGMVAAYREQAQITDDYDAIGPAPRIGQPEVRAAWYAAWRAFGAPAATRDAASLTVAELQSRIEAYERAEAWAPPWVAEELQATATAAAQYRREAVLHAAEAVSPNTEVADVEAVAETAVAYTAMADYLDQQVVMLERVNEARGEWHLHTADLYEAAEVARVELELREATGHAVATTSVADLVDDLTITTRLATAVAEAAAAREARAAGIDVEKAAVMADSTESAMTQQPTVEKVETPHEQLALFEVETVEADTTPRSDVTRDGGEVVEAAGQLALFEVETATAQQTEVEQAAVETANAAERLSEAERRVAELREHLGDRLPPSAVARLSFLDKIPARSTVEQSLLRAEEAVARVAAERRAVVAAEQRERELREQERRIEQERQAQRDGASRRL